MGMDVGGGKGGVKYEPNVVPMIDVMLVLLIIFMVVTPIIASGFQATMPQAKHIEKRDDKDLDITLGIDNKGQFFLSSKDAAGTTRVRPVTDKAQLLATLTEIFNARSTDKILYFKADTGLTYDKVEEAVAIARKAGVRVLAAVTDPRREEGGLFGKR